MSDLRIIAGCIPMSEQMAEAGAIWLGPFGDEDDDMHEVTMPGHVTAVRADTVATDLDGTRHTYFHAEVRTAQGDEISVPLIGPADGLLDRNVEITVRFQ